MSAGTSSTSTDDSNSTDAVWEFEAIVGRRKRGEATEYRIKWVGYRATTWEAEDMILDKQELAAANTRFDAAAATKRAAAGKGIRLENGSWAVSHIAGERGQGRNRQLLLFWVNFNQPTWEPASCLADAELRAEWRQRGDEMEIVGEAVVDGVPGWLVKYAGYAKKCWMHQPPAEAIAVYTAKQQQRQDARQGRKRDASENRRTEFEAGNAPSWAGRAAREDETDELDAMVLRHMPAFRKIQQQVFQSIGTMVSVLQPS